jgi:hypothetical protein
VRTATPDASNSSGAMRRARDRLVGAGRDAASVPRRRTQENRRDRAADAHANAATRLTAVKTVCACRSRRCSDHDAYERQDAPARLRRSERLDAVRRDDRGSSGAGVSQRSFERPARGPERASTGTPPSTRETGSDDTRSRRVVDRRVGTRAPRAGSGAILRSRTATTPVVLRANGARRVVTRDTPGALRHRLPFRPRVRRRFACGPVWQTGVDRSATPTSVVFVV